MHTKTIVSILALMLPLSCTTTEGPNNGPEWDTSERQALQGLNLDVPNLTVSTEQSYSLRQPNTVALDSLRQSLQKRADATKGSARVSALADAIVAGALAGQAVNLLLKDLGDLATESALYHGPNTAQETATLAVANAAWKQRNTALAVFLAGEVIDARSASIRAGALNLQGLALAAQGDWPEAIDTWQAALKLDEQEAIALNLSLAQLRFGAPEAAAAALADLPQDAFVTSQRLAAALAQGQNAAGFCKENGANNAALQLNCASQAVSHGDMNTARSLAEAALKKRGIPLAWQQQAKRLLALKSAVKR